MRISDWSSDVCSSDLGQPPIAQKARHPRPRLAQEDASLDRRILRQDSFGLGLIPRVEEGETSLGAKPASGEHLALFRSEERRGGEGCVSTCRSRWSPYT